MPASGKRPVGACMCEGHRSCAGDSWHGCSYLLCQEGTSIQPYRVAVIILRIVLREAEGKQAEPGYWELSFSKIVMVLNLAGSRDKG